ncbi:MAG: hypothetical protein ACTTKH_05300 [Treponema sp.]
MDKSELENNIIKIASAIFSLQNQNYKSGEFQALKTKLADLI